VEAHLFFAVVVPPLQGVGYQVVHLEGGTSPGLPVEQEGEVAGEALHLHLVYIGMQRVVLPGDTAAFFCHIAHASGGGVARLGDAAVVR
jgi:hypothetical protein